MKKVFLLGDSTCAVKEEEARPDSQIRIITKKPVVPSAEEEKENAPSRSAKLRVVEKI